MATRYSLLAVETVPSTQDVARAAFADSDGPVLVTAERQMAGRGRTGSGWIHAPRAVAASLAFGAPWRVEERGVIPLLAGLAMRAALGGVGADVCLKWPNDVMAPNGDKVGGILSEAVDDVINRGRSLDDTIRDLLSRPSRRE